MQPTTLTATTDLGTLARARRLTRNGAGRSWREQLELHAIELARDIHVNPLTLLRWEAGMSRPSTNNAIAWLAALEAAQNAVDAP